MKLLAIVAASFVGVSANIGFPPAHGQEPPPVYVPRPSSPAEAGVINSFARAVVDQNLAQRTDIIAADIDVAIMRRNVVRSESFVEHEGRGPEAALAQTAIVLAKTGHPNDVSCDVRDTFALCSFVFEPRNSMLIALVTTRDGKIWSAGYTYATRQQIEADMKAAE